MPTSNEILKALESMLLDQDKVHVAKVERHGEKIILPVGMKTAEAIVSLQRQDKYDNELVSLNFDFDYFVWDGAYALSKVMQNRYGFVFGETQYSFFGANPPQLMGIETSLGVVEQVPWGQFTVPSIEGGKFNCGFNLKDGKFNFKLNVVCKHMYEEEVKSVRNAVEAYLKEHSIYKGKAFSVRFTDDDGDDLIEAGVVPTPKFIDLRKEREHELVFPKAVDEAIRTNLFTPIERIQEARAIGVPIKRGVLLAGDFGTGKTLTAYVAAQKAVKNRITYIYCEKPEEFPNVMRFAAQYAPSLVFCEDVDRIVPLDRDKSVDELINVVDGVETKNSEIITVFTTNAIKNVNRALLRPGRMDAVIPVHRPDAEAVVRLVHNYCGQYLEPDVDLSDIGHLLADNIPAVVREVCERSKLSALRLLPIGQPLKYIPVSALKESATTMKMQLELLASQDRVPKTDEVNATEMIAGSLSRIAEAVVISSGKQLNSLNGPTFHKNNSKSLEAV